MQQVFKILTFSLVVFDIWFPYADFYKSLSLRASLEILLLLIFILTYGIFKIDLIIKSVRYYLNFSDEFKILLLFFMYVVAHQIISIILGREALFLKKITNRYLPMMVVIFLIPFFSNRIRDIKIFIYMLCFAVGISSIIAIIQGVYPTYGYTVRDSLLNFFHLSISEVEKIKYMEGLYTSRVSGLSLYSIIFGYSAVVLFSFSLNFFLIEKELIKKMIWGIFLGVSLGGIFFTLTRSLYLAIIVVTIRKFFFKQMRINRKILFLGIFFLLTFTIIHYNIDYFQRFIKRSSRQFIEQDVRKDLFKIGFFVLLKNPFGIGESYESYIKEIEIPYEIQNPQYAYYLTPHNQFINTGVYYGWVPLLMLLYLYFVIFRDISYLRRFGSRDLHAILDGLEDAIIAYIIHSLFHNGGIFIGEYTSWYLVAILISIKKITFRRSIIGGVRS